MYAAIVTHVINIIYHSCIQQHCPNRFSRASGELCDDDYMN